MVSLQLVKFLTLSKKILDDLEKKSESIFLNLSKEKSFFAAR